jgi:transposase
MAAPRLVVGHKTAATIVGGIMFPRIMTVRKPNKTYQYLVISESVRIQGKGSTTRNIANLGNIEKFQSQDIANMIDGLIRLFELDQYALTEEIEILESLEHGSILLWRKLWEKMGLSDIIKRKVCLQEKQVSLEVEKYIELMVVNRCVDPLSKLGATRWVERTCYKMMRGYADLSLDVNQFYRSMDYLLRHKDEIELAIFERLRNLFSVNVKLTFYDITSSYFYSDNCPLSKNGYSRDHRSDLEQIVIGVVTSFEGYPIKHYVFEGNTKDETTVTEVVTALKADYHIEETTFVGDRGMVTQLNLSRIEKEGYSYIMGVKHRQDGICAMLLETEYWEDYEWHKDLKIKERQVRVKDFLIWKTKLWLRQSQANPGARAMARFEAKIQGLTNEDEVEYADFKPLLQDLVSPEDNKLCRKLFYPIKKYLGRYEEEPRYILCLNEERKAIALKKREAMLSRLSKELKKWAPTPEQKPTEIEQGLNKIFAGYKSQYRKFFEIEREEKDDKAIGWRLNKDRLEQEKRLDGIFVLLTTRKELAAGKVVDSYKNLKEVEMLFDDLKHFVDIRPIRHWLAKRVRAHVFLCILSLLLKRIFEINCLGGKSTMEPIEELSKSRLIKYNVRFSEREERTQVIPKVTTTTPVQKKYFNMVGIKNPMSLENFVW